MVVIGLDAASTLSKFGYAIGRYDAGCVQIERAGLIKSKGHKNAIDAHIAPALREADQALVAIDAPLGWTASLAAELGKHRPGDAFSTEKDALFHARPISLYTNASVRNLRRFEPTGCTGGSQSGW